MALRSKVYVFGLSIAGIAVLNPDYDMNVRLSCLLCVLYV